MINKENDDKEKDTDQEDKFIDLARMDVQAHIIIKDKETDEVLLNKRG